MTTGIDPALRNDIRLLGQLLGEVLRTHGGERLYGAVEEIRQTALRFRREEDPGAARRLDGLLRKLSRDETIGVVRAFSFFSHLANIAEDRQLVRNLEHDDAEARPGSLAHAIERLQAHGVGTRRLLSLLGDACLMPVLTAHPTRHRWADRSA
jgi:phosphoenolpyruvate carboxylase